MRDSLDRLRSAFRATVPAHDMASRDRAIAAAMAAFERHHRSNRETAGRMGDQPDAGAGETDPARVGAGASSRPRPGRGRPMMTVTEMRMHLVGRAENDISYRHRLLVEPRDLVEEEFGIAVPDHVNVRVHQDSPSTMHFLLPPNPRLDMAELRQAAGGTGDETDVKWDW